MSSLIEQVRQPMARVAGRTVLVAVSGGADSVALLLTLKELAPRLKLDLVVAHLNHGIRGKAAAADAAFVRRLARQLRLPFRTARVNVPRTARAKGISLEMAAREARYDFLVGAARSVKADAIVTAHTADDQAETLLLRLCRGAGLRGLGAMAGESAVQGIRLLRPLLEVTRRDVLAFLAAKRATWREDETNDDDAFLRNRVRHQVLPLLAREVNPRIREVLTRTAEILRDEETVMAGMTELLLHHGRVGEAGLDLSVLGPRPIALRRRVFHAWLATAGVPAGVLDFNVIERLDGFVQSGKTPGVVEIGEGWRAVRTRGLLSVERGRTPSAETVVERALTVPGRTRIAEWGIVVTTRLAPGLVKQAGGRIGHYPASASLRWRNGMSLRVRAWRKGDRMEPFGMQGSKKLQDIFVDEKTPSAQRLRVPVIVCGRQIAWLPGYRVAREHAVKDAREVSLQIRVTSSTGGGNPLPPQRQRIGALQKGTDT